jgi:multicomponent Na+:H+ antiporter subunit G
MIHLAVALLLATGSTFVLIAAIGVLRMPDVYMRLQVSTKGATLGAGTLLLAVPVFFGDVEIFVRAMLIIAFVFLTTPISGHMLARAAYIVGVPLWKGAVVDELRGRYDPETDELSSSDREDSSEPD